MIIRVSSAATRSRHKGEADQARVAAFSEGAPIIPDVNSHAIIIGVLLIIYNAGVSLLPGINFFTKSAIFCVMAAGRLI